MSDVFAEVDEIMRQERMERLWKNHGGTLLSIVLTLIIGTAGYSGYKAWDSSQRIESTDSLLTLVQDKDFPTNIESDTLDIRSGLKGIALITAAAETADHGDIEKAISLYQAAVEDKSLPDDLKQLAQLNIAKLSHNTDIEIRLATLDEISNSKNSPWRYHAYLESAVILANEKFDADAAIANLNKILETSGLQQTLYDKARALSQIYILKTKQQTPEN